MAVLTGVVLRTACLLLALCFGVISSARLRATPPTTDAISASLNKIKSTLENLDDSQGTLSDKLASLKARKAARDKVEVRKLVTGAFGNYDKQMKNVMATTAENRIRAFINGIPEKPTPPPKLDAVVKEVEQAPAPPEIKKEVAVAKAKVIEQRKKLAAATDPVVIKKIQAELKVAEATVEKKTVESVAAAKEEVVEEKKAAVEEVQQAQAAIAVAVKQGKPIKKLQEKVEAAEVQEAKVEAKAEQVQQVVIASAKVEQAIQAQAPPEKIQELKQAFEAAEVAPPPPPKTKLPAPPPPPPPPAPPTPVVKQGDQHHVVVNVHMPETQGHGLEVKRLQELQSGMQQSLEAIRNQQAQLIEHVMKPQEKDTVVQKVDPDVLAKAVDAAVAKLMQKKEADGKAAKKESYIEKKIDARKKELLDVQAREMASDDRIRRSQQMEQRAQEKINEANNRVKLAEAQVVELRNKQAKMIDENEKLKSTLGGSADAQKDMRNQIKNIIGSV